MHSLRTRCLHSLHHLINDNVGLVGWGWANMDRLIRHLDVQSLLIRVRINGDSANAHFTGSLDNTASDLTTVGDQDLVEHGMSF